MYFDDINDCERENYPELTPSLKEYLLSRPFTQREGDSLNIETIAAYLDDEDIAMKAVKLPTPRFEKILKKYASNWRRKIKDCNKNNIRIASSKTYTSEVMISAARSWMFDLLWEAVEKRVPPPQHTEMINRKNDAINDIHITNKKFGIEEEIPPVMITFESFMRENRKTIIPYMKEHWDIDSQNSSVSGDRERRIYSGIKKEAIELYSQLHKDKLTDYDKITFIFKKKTEVAQVNKSKWLQVAECTADWKRAINHMAALEKKHKEYSE